MFVSISFRCLRDVCSNQAASRGFSALRPITRITYPLYFQQRNLLIYRTNTGQKIVGVTVQYIAYANKISELRKAFAVFNIGYLIVGYSYFFGQFRLFYTKLLSPLHYTRAQDDSDSFFIHNITPNMLSSFTFKMNKVILIITIKSAIY